MGQWRGSEQIFSAVQIMQAGGLIAYPTESVYGLGCDPFNHDAVAKLLQLKGRSFDKGFILLAADWSQVDHLVQPIPPQALARVLATWPGPVTWVFPCSDEVPDWITGGRQTVAIRISDHPICNDLCIQSGGPLISTSANLDGQLPATDERTAKLMFPKGIDYIVEGETGERSTPTPIIDAISGETYRS